MVLLYPILFLSLLISLNAQPSKLILVQLIIRHAERAPIKEFTSESSSKFFPRGLGEISDRGINNAAEMGKFFRSRYRSMGLLNGNTNDDEVFIRSSPVTRSLISAVSFSNSFLGRSSTKLIPLIHTTQNELEEQVLFIIESPLFRCRVLALHNISDPLCRSSLLKEKIISSYPVCSNLTYNSIEAALVEMEEPLLEMNKELRICARKYGKKIAYQALNIVTGVGNELDLMRAREAIGPLMTIVKKNIDKKINGKTNKLFRIYYTHDNVILSLSQSLGIISQFKGNSPEFSSTIVIEIWKKREEIEIKIIMKNGIKNQLKEVSRMNKSTFNRKISQFVERDFKNIQWDENLTEIYSSAQYHEDLQPSIM